LLAFTYSKFQGSVRHDGPLFVALITAFWIAWALQRAVPAGRWPWGRRMVRAVPQAALSGFLAIQVVAAYVACYYAWNFPFSPAREAAAMLRSKLTAEDQLMTSWEPPTASLAAYLPGRKFWMPESSRWGTFTIWKQMPSSPGGPGAAMDLANRTRKPVVLVENGSVGTMPGMTCLGAFTGGITGDENYYVYRIIPGAKPGRGTSGQPEKESLLDRMMRGLGGK
jgi:hypothetical protein